MSILVGLPPEARQDMQTIFNGNWLIQFSKGREEVDELYWKDFQLK
jgi:hypothetical protein